MNKMNIRRVFGLILSVVVAGGMAASCYDDSELRNSIDNLKSQLSQLQSLVSTLQNDDAVTGVTTNADGSCTITFKKSGAIVIRNGKDGENGKDGNDGEPGKDGKDGSIVDVIAGDDIYTFVFSDGTTVILPRYSEVRVLTFEDADYKGPSEIVDYWSSMIDEPQFGGSILYGDGCIWEDANNTFLTGGVSAYDAATYTGGLSGGGIAVSNYGNGMIAGADYLRQLECFAGNVDGFSRSGAGNGGSDNFGVIYVGFKATEIAMKDGKARIVESAYINNTCYTLNSLLNGDEYSAPMADTGFFKIVATGYSGEEVTGTTEFFLAKYLSVVSEWTKWDLSTLGAVDRIEFTVAGSPDLYGEWGLNAPSYFAIDDIAVRVYPE